MCSLYYSLYWSDGIPDLCEHCEVETPLKEGLPVHGTGHSNLFKVCVRWRFSRNARFRFQKPVALVLMLLFLKPVQIVEQCAPLGS